MEGSVARAMINGAGALWPFPNGPALVQLRSPARASAAIAAPRTAETHRRAERSRTAIIVRVAGIQERNNLRGEPAFVLIPVPGVPELAFEGDWRMQIKLLLQGG